jgi:RimJ/RimL family protein N-acetyltransferase
MVELSTERLIMRGWLESDVAPWAAMNADPEVRQYLGPLLTVEQAPGWILNFQGDLDRNGFGFWAVEVRASGEFIGFTGLDTVDKERSFSGLETAWRRTRAVMRRIGMTSDPMQDFDDPDVDEGPLRRHVVYRKRLSRLP